MGGDTERPGPIGAKCRRLIAVALAGTAIAVTVAAVRGADAIVIAAIVAGGVSIVGLLLWWHGSNTARKWDEIGRAIVVSVLLAVVVGVPQYLIDRREKERDFELSLTLQDNLRGADLSGRDLSGLRLQGKTLAEADLEGATLDDAQLLRTDLSGADLTDARLRGADLRETNLEDATLEGADLRGAVLKNASLLGANLAGADLRDADLEISVLRTACLAGADLRGAKLAGAEVARVVFTGADLRGAVFESDLRPAQLLSHAGLAGVRYDGDTRWPLGFEYRAAAQGRPEAARAEPPRRPGDAFPARVVEVEDGDTLRLQPTSARGRRQVRGPGRARLIGVNAPDPTDSGGADARRFVADRLVGRTVHVRLGAHPVDDGYRHLVYVWRPGRRASFNEELLDSGHASLQLRKNRRFSTRFVAAETRGKQRGRGLWRECPEGA